MLLSSGDNFPHLIQKRRSQLGFVTYLLNYPRMCMYVCMYVCIASVYCIVCMYVCMYVCMEFALFSEQIADNAVFRIAWLVLSAFEKFRKATQLHYVCFSASMMKVISHWKNCHEISYLIICLENSVFLTI